MVGIKLSPYNNEINHKRLGPANALIESVKEVYFVTTSSLNIWVQCLLDLEIVHS